MASDEKSRGADGERRSPLPSDTPTSRLLFSEGRAAQGETTGEGGLVLVERKESKNRRTDPAGEGTVKLSSVPDPLLDDLWKRAERVMGARRASVREVMEDFGVADVPPVTDHLEEQLWQVVQGELTLQEAADLV